MARDYRKIRAWQLADELAFGVYKATESFSRAEAYGLTSQIRRAAVSVPANIVEGATRNHTKEYLQFLYQAAGSLAELGYHLEFSRRIGYVPDEEAHRLLRQQDVAARTLRALIAYIERAGSQSSKVHSRLPGV